MNEYLFLKQIRNEIIKNDNMVICVSYLSLIIGLTKNGRTELDKW